MAPRLDRNLTHSLSLYLAFASRHVRSICESESEADLHLGPDAAAELRRRLADLDAAPTLGELPPSVTPRLNGAAAAAELVVEMDGGWEFAFTASHIENPTTPDGKIDWGRVSRIKILRIVRTDEQP